MIGVLLSGGMDSIALAYWKRPDIAFTIDYGQRAAEAEIEASTRVAAELGLRHEILRVDCGPLGSGDMAGSAALDNAPASDWWPYRNQLLITLAAMRGVGLGVKQLFLGTVQSDEIHADGREAFYRAIDAVMALQEGEIRIEAPALALSTVELIHRAQVPEALIAWAHSCHTGNLACGTCRGCVKHYYVTREVFGHAY
jgi:7-cyano-7-deazaguanine synthase